MLSERGEGRGEVPPPPVPVSGTISGLPGAFEVISSWALRAPEARGVNRTEKVRATPAGRSMGALGLSVTEKSMALAPEGAMLEIVTSPVPVFLTVRI